MRIRFNKPTIADTLGATLDIEDGKLFVVLNSIYLSGVDGSELNIGAGGTLGKLAYQDAIDGGDITGLTTTGTGAFVLQDAPILNNPALAGNPTAVTQSHTDNSTKIATTAYVKTVISDLINSAPAILDTLGELATAVQSDETAISGIITSLSNKQPLNSNLTTLSGLSSISDLTAIAGMSTTGVAIRTGSGTWNTRTLTGASVDQVIITNGDGISGNPTFSLPQSINTTSNPRFSSLGIGQAASINYGVAVTRNTTDPSANQSAFNVSSTTNSLTSDNAFTVAGYKSDIRIDQNGHNVTDTLGLRAIDAAYYATGSSGTVTGIAGAIFTGGNTGAGVVTTVCGAYVAPVTNSGGGTISNNVGFLVETQTVGSAIYAFRGKVAASSGRWNLYMDGTALNYLAGGLQIGNSGTGLALFEARSTSGAQIAGSYNGSNFWTATTASDGAVTFDAMGAGASFTFSEAVVLSSTLNGNTITTGTGTLTLSSFTLTVSGTSSINQNVTTSGSPQFAGLGVGTAAVAYQGIRNVVTLSGSTTQTGITSVATGGSGATTAIRGIYSGVQTAAASFTCVTTSAFWAQTTVAGSGSTITNCIGFDSDVQTAGSILNASFRGVNTVASGTWNLYMSGNAANYLAGGLQIGHSGSALGTLEARATSGSQIVGSYDATNYWDASTSSSGVTTFTPHGSGSCFIFGGTILLSDLTTNGFVKTTSSDGLLSVSSTVNISEGGTGQTTAYAGLDALTVKGADIASATTTDLSTATGGYVDITGTTTITSFGTAAAGVERTLRFTGVLTLTHNATSLILPGGANVTTAAGDTAIFRSLGSGNWRCILYTVAANSPGSGSGGTITLSGDVSGSGTTAITTTIGAGKVTNAMLNGGTGATFQFAGIGLGVAAPLTGLKSLTTSTQITTLYDASNYMTITTGSTGSTTFALTGTSPTFTFSQAVVLSALSSNGFVKTSGGTGALSVSSTVADGEIASALTGKTYDGLTITSTTGTFTLTNAKTFSVSNTLTLAGTDGSTLNVGAGGTLGTGAFQPQTVLTGTTNQITVSNGGVGATTYRRLRIFILLLLLSLLVLVLVLRRLLLV